MAGKFYSFYPGCSLEATGRNFDLSTRAVCSALGLPLVDLPDWSCCGATPYMAIDPMRSVALSARNLAIAGKEKRDLAVVCPACYTILNKAKQILAENKELRTRLSRELSAWGLDLDGDVPVRHLLDLLVNDLGHNGVFPRLRKPLRGLRVACYYGCQIVRPFSTFDDQENPTSMDQIMTWIEATPVDYALKTKCCAGMLMSTNQEAALPLVRDLLRAAHQAKAECISVACPLCFMNLDTYQDQLEKEERLPVLYFTQLLGHSLGLGEKELGLHMGLSGGAEVLRDRSEQK
jgi:heterodisulfide reductase subunit B